MSLLLSPMTLLVVGLALAAIAGLARRRRIALLGVGLGAVGLLGMTPIVANALVGTIEARAADGAGRTRCGRIDAVVLLTGGVERAPVSAHDFGALTPQSLQRVFGFAQRPRPQRIPLLVAGGGPHGLAESELAAALLRRIDPDAGAMQLETRSRTTWENAREVAQVLLPPRTLALATDALHLPRARRAFEAAGFEVCAWPLQYRYVRVEGPGAWWPQASSLRKTEAALHEIAGDAAYAWRAWRARGGVAGAAASSAEP